MHAPPFSRNSVFLIRVLIVFSLFFLIRLPEAQCARKKQGLQRQRLRILREWDGNLSTVNKGLGKDLPPHLKVFRDREGILFQIREFEKIRNRNTHARVAQLSKEILQVNFSRNMVIGIFSQPTDNYFFSVKKVLRTSDRIAVNLIYRHEGLSYSILPSLKIYYSFLVVKKNNLPVLLTAKADPRKKKKRHFKRRIQTIYGTLKRWENVRNSIGLERRIKGKEHLYYIRDSRWIKELMPFLGKRVGVKGYVLREPGSIYESEIKISEIIKISDIHHKKRRR